MFKKSGKILKYCAVGIVAGSSLIALKKNDWDVSTTGVVRFGRAAKAAAAVVVDYKKTLGSLEKDGQEYAEKKSEVHWRSARKLRDMCAVNGGCFIKVGQHIGALEFLLPKEYVETMKVFHSEAPQSSLTSIHNVIREELGKEVDEIYESFDENPLGAASLAQVHKAKLKDGRIVAVKVQHPNVRTHSVVDMKTMELLVHTVAKIFPEFQFLWLAEETKKNLPLELDFVHEAKNCERVAKILSHYDYLKVPKILWDMTTERVLTMEFCEGGQVNDKEFMKKNNISVEEVSSKLGHLYSEMIFFHGYVHCDPHPGNVLVNQTKKGVEIILLDHGLYQTLTEKFRIRYCKLWQSILERNVIRMKKYSEKLGIGRMYPLFACMVTGRSWKAITSGIEKQKFSTDEDSEIRSAASNYLPEISDILNNVPREMLLIFKTNDLLRGIETTLKTRTNSNSFIAMSKFCIRAVYEYKRSKCDNFFCRFRCHAKELFALFSLNLYALYLRIRNVGQNDEISDHF